MISVIIGYYNDALFLRESITSVLSQVTEWELFLVNHASTDGSRDVARQFRDPRIVHWDMERNTGASGHEILTEALKHARGEYVKPFCADDILMPNALSDLEYNAVQSRADVIFGDMQFCTSLTKQLPVTWFARHPFKSGNQVLKQYYHHGRGVLPYPGALIKTSCLGNNNFNLGLIQMADMYLWASLLLKGCKFASLANAVCHYRIHANQLSSVTNTLAGPRSVHEGFVLADLLDTCTDLSIIQNLWSKSRLLRNENTWSKEDIPFLNAYHMAHSHIYAYFYWGCSRLNSLLNSPERARYREKFKFGILEYRNIYTKKFSHSSTINFLLHIKLKLKKALARALYRSGQQNRLDVQ
jgi:glycosyltransferase involved in cell wall biosynthesis